jgi:hypothetical protein
MDEETRQICEIVRADNPEIAIFTPQEFEKYWADRFANT